MILNHHDKQREILTQQWNKMFKFCDFPILGPCVCFEMTRTTETLF